jgi:hypothetical protein
MEEVPEQTATAPRQSEEVASPAATSPFGRMVRFIPPRKPGIVSQRVYVAIGVTEAWEDEWRKNNATRLQTFDRMGSGSHLNGPVPHCERGMRPCWCWPHEVEEYRGG